MEKKRHDRLRALGSLLFSLCSLLPSSVQCIFYIPSPHQVLYEANINYVLLLSNTKEPHRLSIFGFLDNPYETLSFERAFVENLKDTQHTRLQGVKRLL